MAAFVNILSGFGMLIGLISVIYPLRFIYIDNRRTAAAVLGLAFAAFVVSAIVDGSQRQKVREQQALAVPPKPPKSIAELADEACNVSGAIPNCREVIAKQLAEEAAHPKKREPARASNNSSRGDCKSDWRQCSDNADLMNNFAEIARGELSCQYAAKRLAKYGSPSFPFFSFSRFHTGNDYVSTGVATLIEPDAQFQNAYGVMVHTIVSCKYNLRSQLVADVSVED